MAARKYKIKKEVYGMTVATEKPKTFKGSGIFVLNNKLTQKEMEYLYKVLGLHTHIELAD